MNLKLVIVVGIDTSQYAIRGAYGIEHETHDTMTRHEAGNLQPTKLGQVCRLQRDRITYYAMLSAEALPWRLTLEVLRRMLEDDMPPVFV